MLRYKHIAVLLYYKAQHTRQSFDWYGMEPGKQNSIPGGKINYSIFLTTFYVLLNVHVDNICNENQLDALFILNPLTPNDL
jgi:hypothetical protein